MPDWVGEQIHGLVTYVPTLIVAQGVSPFQSVSGDVRIIPDRACRVHRRHAPDSVRVGAPARRLDDPPRCE
jgi:hypothetical protein